MKLEQLRSQAVQIGVGGAFDQQLRVLFADVYGNRPMPPPSLISAGAPLLSSFGGAKGAALQFHMLHATQQPIAGFSTTTPSPMPKERQFATAPGAPIIVGA